MSLAHQPREHWPRLAWLARCGGDGDVVIEHGPGVETSDVGVCEAVWPAPFADWGFDEESVVAGTGVRMRDGVVTFVSSTSTVDRLYSMRTETESLVSNSLPCLLEAAGAAISPDYKASGLVSIKRGLKESTAAVPTTAGTVELVYYHDLVWDGKALSRRDKPAQHLTFGDFAAYRAYLSSRFQGIAVNMGSPDRREPYSFMGTISSGYDSVTVTTLGTEAGCSEAISFSASKRGRSDSGEAVADALGIRLRLVSPDAWMDVAEQAKEPIEVPFYAAAPHGGQLPFAALGDALRGRVLLTGFYGDSIWDLESHETNEDIVRKDASGLTFTEFRLRAGFIHCPPSFWAAREIGQVAEISRSDEMRPWVIGDEYQRPICRRIAEEAGIPREAFGQHKKVGVAGSRLAKRDFLSDRSMRDYTAWLEAHQDDGDDVEEALARDRRDWRRVRFAGLTARATAGSPASRSSDLTRSCRAGHGSIAVVPAW